MGVTSWSEYGRTFYINITIPSTINISGNLTPAQNLLPSVSLKFNAGEAYTGRVGFSASYYNGTWGTSIGQGASLYYGATLLSGNLFAGTNAAVSNNTYGVASWLPNTGASSVSTSTLFNSSNKTSRTVTLTLKTASGAYSFGDFVVYRAYASTQYTLATYNVTLEAPPTFSETFSYTGDFSGVPYANLTTANVDLSDLTALYGGDFSGVGNAEFIIGSQSVSKPNPVNGDVLTIALNAVGTFTPIVKITDSRGQVTTHTLSAITVMGYNAPTVSFDASRTLSDGTPDDEGTYAFIEATFNFTDVIADAVAPSVVVTDDDGTVTTPVVDWYTDAGLTTPVTWSSLSSGDTVYGIFSGLSTQHSYTVSIRPRDSEGTGTAVTQTIGAAFYTVDFLAGGHGIAFGQPAGQTGFFCNMDAHFEADCIAQDMSSQDVSDFVDGLNVTGINVIDYVVEQGTSGIWTYRKWSSGVSECWCNLLVHPSITTAYGSLYIANLGQTNLPSGLFISRPNLQGSVDLAGGVGGVAFTSVSNASFQSYVFNGSSYNATTKNIYVSIHAIGTWK